MIVIGTWQALASDCRPSVTGALLGLRIGFGHGCMEPVIKAHRFGNMFGCLSAELTHVVVAHARADDQHVFLAQRCERSTHLNVLGRIEPSLQAHHHTGMSASGNATIRGMNTPWSKPRSASSADGIPASSRRDRTRLASAGLPGRGSRSHRCGREIVIVEQHAGAFAVDTVKCSGFSQWPEITRLRPVGGRHHRQGL